jgi:hypothetical protein
LDLLGSSDRDASVNVVYLDQNAAIDLAEAASPDSRFYRTRQITSRLVEQKIAIFPYSSIHLLESAHMSDASKAQLAGFWQTVSRGYRFTESKNIRTQQFLDILHGKPMRFRQHLVILRDQVEFAESLDWPTYSSLRNARITRFREVVEHWSTLTREQINQGVRTAEAGTAARMLIDMFNRALRGELPSLDEIDSEYNTIASELAWAFRETGAGDNAWFKAMEFMRDRSLDVPAVEIECVGLEALAEQYASDNPRRRAVERSRLDHDINDLSAVSNFVPYCIGGILDANAIAIVRRAYRKLHRTPPTLFTYRELDAFNDFLDTLPVPEQTPVPLLEIERSEGRVLLTVPVDGDELVRREPLGEKDGVICELLPFGGVKVSSESSIAWQTLLSVLESIDKEFGSGGEATLHGGTSTVGCAQILLSLRVPFGIFDVAREDIQQAFEALVGDSGRSGGGGTVPSIP